MLHDPFDIAELAVHPVLERIEVILRGESLIQILFVTVHGDLDLVHYEVEADLILRAQFLNESLLLLF
jgi:hypothetical protein